MGYYEFVKQLKTSDSIARTDKTIFEKWADKSISTEVAIDKFKRNNNINCPINNYEFVFWMQTLGYIRG